MNYLSVCSGIEAATVAWHPLGWNPIAFSEIENFPAQVLTHHYPNTPNWGDMTKFKEWPNADVNVLVGGTPCQSFSVAGLRKGLDDPRGNLMLTYLAIANQYRPEWVVWENVPGVLSSNGGQDFASFLRGLAELGYGFAYRILDAQYFGVAQRRRRVFVVGHIRDWQRAAAVLFERHSLQGHPAPRREAGKGFTHSVAPSLTSSGRGVERGGDTRGQDPVIACDVAGALDTQCGGGKLTHQSVVNGHVLPVMGTLTTRTFTALGARDIEEGALVPMISHSLTRRYDSSEDETGRGTPLVPIQNALRSKSQNGLGIGEGGELMYTLDKTSQHAVGFSWQKSTISTTLDKSTTPAVHHAMQVRRLTPKECERLQGFPDDYTLVPYRKKPAADGPRYKSLGNSMAVPVMRWIGERIKQVEGL